MLEHLQAQLGDKCSVNTYIREAHGRDENATPGQLPVAVVFAETTADVQTTLAVAHTYQMPVIAFGAGTSFEGHVVPQGPAISLDLSRMKKVLRLAADDFTIDVEPGITRSLLNAAVRPVGLFFPVDPGADATLGGMAATNASGTTTVRYGGMRANVLALEVVIANGEVLTLGRPVRKTSSGYDLKDLFIGSAGTLGIITKLTLRLHPVPEHVHTLRVSFPSIATAAQAAYQIMASALPVARLELVDALTLRAINRSLGRSYPEQPALFLEFHSSTAEAIEAEAALAHEIVLEQGAERVDTARTADERDALWEARHRAYWALTSQFPGRRYYITDTAVPLTHLVEVISYGSQLLADLHLDGSIIGHVGDGNFHVMLAVLPEMIERAHEYSDRLVTKALSVGGTASGEHGIGLVKRPYMAAEHGAALGWMQSIKHLFDPLNLLNPGKQI